MNRLGLVGRIALGSLFVLVGIAPLAAFCYAHVKGLPEPSIWFVGIGIAAALYGAHIVDREDSAAAFGNVVDGAVRILTAWKGGGSPPPPPPAGPTL
ncbi:MAG TPA: hypothetical protein VFN76_10045 [Candidatus Limnocylindria bacterium]|nr:hypothetical protein [Candidatus Limnocylindria bacterium]